MLRQPPGFKRTNTLFPNTTHFRSLKPNRLYNIGNHRSEHLMKGVGILEEQCGRKAEIEYLPMQPGDVRQSFADIEAISRDLGYAPTTSIDVGVPNFVR